MERKIGQVPGLSEYLDEYDDGDILGGIMVNYDFMHSRTRSPAKSPEEAAIPHQSNNEHSLEAIGADNFRGLSEENTIIDLGADNFRAKQEA